MSVLYGGLCGDKKLLAWRVPELLYSLITPTTNVWEESPDSFVKLTL